MDFTTNNFSNLRKDIKEGLKDVEDKYGIKFDMKDSRINYNIDGSSFQLKIVVNNGSDEEILKTKEDKVNKLLNLYAIDNLKFGNIVMDSNGELYKVSDFITSKRKYPVIVNRLKDKRDICFTISGAKGLKLIEEK